MRNYTKTICGNEVVFFIEKDVIDDFLIKKILNEINKNQYVGIDMKNVKSINSKRFIKALEKDLFRLFNLRSEILAYLSIIIKDGKLKSYMNLADFKAKKRELIRRHFYCA